MRRLISPLVFILSIFAILVIGGCSQKRAYSTTYHSQFFGLFKPKAKRAPTPQAAHATRSGGRRDPFSRHARPHRYKLDGDGYHTIVRHKRHQPSMGAPARHGSKTNSFFQRKSRHRRGPASEDRKIFGKYKRRGHKKH
jgi:hypothetical protein